MVNHWNMNHSAIDQTATESRPSQIQIGPILYDIVEVENLTDTDEQNRVISLLGNVAYGQQRIQIEASMSPEMKRAIVWHEALHAVLEQAGINDHPENIVTVLGYAIPGILKNNPWMATP